MEITTEIEVRYSETDRMGIVYHANYLVWCEVARTHVLNEIGFPYTEVEASGYISPVLSFELNYGLPFTYGDIAVVYTRVSKVTAARTEYSYRIFKKGEDPAIDKPRVWGTSTHCIVDAENFKPQSQKRAIPGLYAKYKEICTPEV